MTNHQHRRSRPVLARSSGRQDSSVTVASPHRASPSSPIRSGRGACGERKSRHDMAGFAKGMTTTSGWALLRCDCRIWIHQDCALHRSRTMTMAAAAGSGGDVKDSIEESIAQDSADGNNSCYIFESLIFRSFVDAAAHRTSKLRRGYGAFQRPSSCMPTARTLWAYLFSSTTCSEGDVCGSASMCDGPHAGFPRRARCQRRRGSGRTSRRRPYGAAPTSPPEGVFRHKRRMELVELSGRTAGRLGYTWPTTAYAIGGTAT